MSKNKVTVPDAWEDDWETQADKIAQEPEKPTLEPEVKLSRAERKAKHNEQNKQLWDDAEAVKEKPIFLQARPEPAYKTDIKPTMKVLSRKPPPKIASRADATSGLSNLNLEDEDDSEEENRKKAAVEFEERKVRAAREREEKQRRYQEVRDKLFGAEEGSSRANEGASRNSSSRGKGRGRETRGTGSNDQSPARLGGGRKQLYDAGYTEKPNSAYLQRKANAEAGGSGQSTPNEEHKPVRAPKGPDGSGRGGFGFAQRGGGVSNAS